MQPLKFFPQYVLFIINLFAIYLDFCFFIIIIIIILFHQCINRNKPELNLLT